MQVQMTIRNDSIKLTSLEESRIQRQLDGLRRRLQHRPEPQAILVFDQLEGPRRIEADLRVILSPAGPQLISHQIAPAPDVAVRLAVEEIERQLEKHAAFQRNEPSYGVPSRRNPPSAGAAEPEAEEEA